MSKPTLNVPGIHPSRIECEEKGGVQTVKVVRMGWIAKLDPIGVTFCFADDDGKAVMNAAIDHWRATGRLFPEPLPEPVECVCGGKGKLRIDGEVVFCGEVRCRLAANTVEQWSIMQAALKAAKEGKQNKADHAFVPCGHGHSPRCCECGEAHS